MKKKLLTALLVVVALTGLLLTYSSWSSRNTAKTEAQKVLAGFPAATASRWYCENGSGKGIDNQTPWWEEIYLSDARAEETAKRVEERLRSSGYPVTRQYIENSDDSYNLGKTFWDIRGTSRDYSVQARVGKRELTRNNCFKGSSRMDESLKPENYNSVIVIRFRSLP